jgi:hypothetical protein
VPPMLRRVGRYAASLSVLLYVAWLAIYAVANWPWT